MKSSDLDTSNVFRTIMIITGLVVIIGGMIQAKDILIPLMMAMFISFRY